MKLSSWFEFLFIVFAVQYRDLNVYYRNGNKFICKINMRRTNLKTYGLKLWNNTFKHDPLIPIELMYQ